MRIEKWFITDLDDFQREIIRKSIDESIVVEGAAGSGKTNLAIHRALQAKGKGSYAIVVFTIALKRMVAYGMQALGLDKERIAYDWAWIERGFDLTGYVYKEITNNKTLYLVNDTTVRKFVRVERKTPISYGLDFTDWVEPKFYKAFGRRHSWFEEIFQDINFDIEDTQKYELVSNGILYKQPENKIDYLIIDEAQDFSIFDYNNKILSRCGKSISLFGDSFQKINKNGSSINDIANTFHINNLSLKYNYRIPKTIAKVAQQIIGFGIDLISNNLKDGGYSDFPYYPKPVISKFSSREKELENIVNRIKLEDLDDVAILVPNEQDVFEVNKYFTEHGLSTQVHYRYNEDDHFRTVNTLDFTNNDLPCILTYYAAKGSEFDNVFVPFANMGNDCSLNSFYVACTRSSYSLHISYTGDKISYLNKVSSDYIVETQA